MSRLVNGIYVIEPEDSNLCEICGQIRETRPVGPNNCKICYECAHKPEYIEESTKKLESLIKGSKGVVINI